MGQKGASATMVAPLSFPANGPIARLQDWNCPRFIVTVDTEEEFDWSGPFTRDRHGLSHLRAIDPFQKLCENNGVKPIYLVDYRLPQIIMALNHSKALSMPAGLMLACSSIPG